MTYDYAPLYRPPSSFTLPAGWELVAQGKNFRLPERPDLPIRIDKPFGVVRYGRPLTEAEIEDYQLEPV